MTADNFGTICLPHRLGVSRSVQGVLRQTVAADQASQPHPPRVIYAGNNRAARWHGRRGYATMEVLFPCRHRTMRLLDDANFHATCGDRMRNVTYDSSVEPVDIWPYVSRIPRDDVHPFDIDGQDVEYVYRTTDDRFDHVLIPTKTKNVYLVLVVDLGAKAIHGHHVLNLNEKYGLLTPPAE